MKYNPEIHKRKSIRLKGYDYSQAGLYFITICIQNRELLFGKIENDEMILNDGGQMIKTEWEKLPHRFSNIELHEFVVMPNHFHGILEIVEATDTSPENETGKPPVGATLVVARNDMAQNKPVAENNAGQPIIRAEGEGATGGQGATTRVAPTDADPQNDTGAPTDKTVGDMMGAFKSITTVEYIYGVKNSGWLPFNGKLWQRDYYEHIIRNVRSYENISDYITGNPARWQEDKFYRI